MLTLLLSTYNRSDVLAKTLDSFTELAPPEDGWKVVIVDNRSDDNTREVALSFQDRLPLSYIYEAKPGKSAALNRGLAEREGNLVVITDDDVIARKDWLTSLEAAANSNPSYHLFGGRIMPRWEAKPCDWLAEAVSMQGNFALTDPDWSDGPIMASCIFGPNMACKSDVFDKGLRFDELIATDGTTTFPMGDETDFLVRAEREGFKAWFVHDAVVEHMIPASNIKPNWLILRAFRQGRGKVVVFQKTALAHLPKLFGSPRFLWRALLGDSLRVFLAYLQLSRPKILKARCTLNYRWGQIYQHRIFSRRNHDG